MTQLMRTDATYAEIFCSVWAARCMRPWCANVLAVERGQTELHCVGADGCGWSGELLWPADPDGIEIILSFRPVPTTRNWLVGETLEDLIMENATHNCIPQAWRELAEAGGGKLCVLEAEDERVTGGLLLWELIAAGRREIGA